VRTVLVSSHRARRRGLGRPLAAGATLGRRALAFALAVGAVVGAAGSAAPARAQPLPALNLDRSQTTVSGLSSGGYMAVQLHVAYSSVFRRGAAAVAAGPYFCAEGQLSHATGRCLRRDTPIPVPALQSTALRWAQAGRIDPLDNLQQSRVLLFSGTRDSAVRQSVTDDLQRWYEAFVPSSQLRYLRDVPAEHGMVTDDFGNACDLRGLPYVQDCDFDLAGEILATLLGPLAPRHDGTPRGRLFEFDQHRHATPGRGLSERGMLYLPPACEPGVSGPPCRLHVVLHGCGQNVESLGDTYVRRTGYLRWADTNRIVLLYPQTSREALNACWDWWGYTGADYATKAAPQMAAIVSMIDELSGRQARCHAALNLAHLWAGRARFALPWGFWGLLQASGSGDPMGFAWQHTTLVESPPTHFRAAGEGAC
jgi:poly(3-hydroxybutyrate) depolymerase